MMRLVSSLTLPATSHEEAGFVVAWDRNADAEPRFCSGLEGAVLGKFAFTGFLPYG
jgi:hypothetical protein